MVHFFQFGNITLIARQTRSKNEDPRIRGNELQQMSVKDARAAKQGYSLSQFRFTRTVQNDNLVVSALIRLCLPHFAVIGRPFQRNLHVITQLTTHGLPRRLRVRTTIKQSNIQVREEEIGLVQRIRLDALRHASTHPSSNLLPHTIVMEHGHTTPAVTERTFT